MWRQAHGCFITRVPPQLVGFHFKDRLCWRLAYMNGFIKPHASCTHTHNVSCFGLNIFEPKGNHSPVPLDLFWLVTICYHLNIKLFHIVPNVCNDVCNLRGPARMVPVSQRFQFANPTSEVPPWLNLLSLLLQHPSNLMSQSSRISLTLF